MLETIISAIAIILGALIQSKIGFPLISKREPKIKMFDMPKDKRYNEEFYDYFIKKIKSAENCIYVTGDGMNYSDEIGTKIADRYINAYKEALNNKVSIVRLEYGNPKHPKWKTELKELLNKYPNLFKLYILKKEGTQIASFCVIDEHLEKKNVIEIMLPLKGTFGVKSTKLAGPAIFIHRCKEYARNIIDEIQRIINDEEFVTHIDSIEKYDEVCQIE